MSSGGESDDMFDKQLTESAKDDGGGSTLKESLMNSMKDTVKLINEPDPVLAKTNVTAPVLTVAAPLNKTKMSQQKYSDSEAFQEQKDLLSKLESIYLSPDNDGSKKVMLFTSEICVPQILKKQEFYTHLNKSMKNKTDEEGYIQIENESDK